MIEFLIREQLAEAHSGWEKALETSDAAYRDKQLKAAARRRQKVAVAELERLGYRVTAPLRASCRTSEITLICTTVRF